MPLQSPRPFSAVLARGLVSRGSALGMSGLAAAGVLAGCGSAGKNPTDGASPADGKLTKSVPDLSDTDKVLNWSNWPEYIDLDDRTRKRPSLDGFTKKTGGGRRPGGRRQSPDHRQRRRAVPGARCAPTTAAEETRCNRAFQSIVPG